MSLDLKVFELIHGLAGASGVLDFFGVLFAEYLPFVFGIALLFFVMKRRGVRERVLTFLYLLFTGVVSHYVLVPVIKFIVPRERPFVLLKIIPLVSESGSSFPSGHAAFFFAMAFVLFAMDKKWGTWFLVFAILNGAARIFVGVLYPLDVVGGAAVGLITYLIFKFLFLKNHEPAAVSEPAEDTGELEA